MLTNIFILASALALIMKGATIATKNAALLAESFRLSKYIVGFIIIAVISILPETLVVINSALAGIPAFGLGTLFGSNVADLTLVFAIVIILLGRGLKVESKILDNRWVYPAILLLPLILGIDGFYGRIDGLVLIIVGAIFYYTALRDGVDNTLPAPFIKHRLKDAAFFLAGMALLLIGSHFTVSSATALAADLGVSPIIIGMLIVGIGTTIPELFFAIKSIKREDDSLAIGDILGTVLADATIVVGIIAMISPFSFPRTVIYITGAFMVIAAIFLYLFMYTDKELSKKEAIVLFLFWVIFAIVEFFTNQT